MSTNVVPRPSFWGTRILTLSRSITSLSISPTTLADEVISQPFFHRGTTRLILILTQGNLQATSTKRTDTSTNASFPSGTPGSYTGMVHICSLSMPLHVTCVDYSRPSVIPLHRHLERLFYRLIIFYAQTKDTVLLKKHGPHSISLVNFGVSSSPGFSGSKYILVNTATTPILHMMR